MHPLKAAFHVIDRYRENWASLTEQISTDRYDRQIKTEVCLAAEWFPYNYNHCWIFLAVIVKFIRKPEFKGYFLKFYWETKKRNKTKQKKS